MLFFFFFNDTATTEIYTLSLHDALPISPPRPHTAHYVGEQQRQSGKPAVSRRRPRPDRKSTRLNSSHSQISYAVFCLKKKKMINAIFSCIPYTQLPDVFSLLASNRYIAS